MSHHLGESPGRRALAACSAPLCSLPISSGACSQGSLRSKKTGSPMVSASISFIISCISGGGSFCSPSRAASSEVK